MKAFKPEILNLGPAATHNMPCCVDYLAEEKAVYSLGSGVFHPSWKAQERGFKLIRVENKFQGWLIRKFFRRF